MATEFKLPEVGEGIDAGTVVAVLISAGDRVEVDQPVLELETDKAVVEVPSSLAGVVERVAVEEGQEVAIGSVVMTVAEGEEAAAGAEASEDTSETPKAEDDAAGSDAAAGEGGAGDAEDEQRSAPAPRPERPVASAPETATDERSPGGLIPAAPSVRRLARELGVELRAVQGSGVLGRISAEDVRAYAGGGSARLAGSASAASAPSAPVLPDFSKWGETERVAMSGIRKATVRMMTTAWSTIPMVTHFDEADATEFEALRQRHKGQAAEAGAKLTPTAMLLKVVAGALRKFPDFNASIDVGSNEIVYKSYVNIGVAVDTEHGLLVPVVKNADRKNVIELAVELGEMAEKARARKLSPDEMQGGNFSVSNLGGIGGTGFTPIVAPPDVAILGVSRGGKKPVWDEEAGAFVPRTMMPLSLTYDHRLIDGASAARFLRWVCRAIEEPFLLSLEG